MTRRLLPVDRRYQIGTGRLLARVALIALIAAILVIAPAAYPEVAQLLPAYRATYDRSQIKFQTDDTNFLADKYASDHVQTALRQLLPTATPKQPRTVGDVITLVERASGLQISVNWQRLRSVGIGPGNGLRDRDSGRYEGLSAQGALTALYQDAALSGSHAQVATLRVVWWVDDRDVVRVSTSDDPAIAMPNTRAHGIHHWVDGGVVKSVSPKDKTPDAATMRVVGKLRRAVGKDEWETKQVKVFVAGGALVVQAPEEVQTTIAAVLKRWYWRDRMFEQAWKRRSPIAGRVAIVVFAAVGAYAFYVRRRLKRANDLAVCDNCGYDLRASPERCPECGLVRNLASD